MAQHPVPRTVEEVFSDYKGRRAGLIKALTTGQSLHHSRDYYFSFLLNHSYSSSLSDVEKFYQLCDPGQFSLSFSSPCVCALFIILQFSTRYFLLCSYSQGFPFFFFFFFLLCYSYACLHFHQHSITYAHSLSTVHNFSAAGRGGTENWVLLN